MKPSVTLSLLAIVICFAIAVKVHKNYTVKDKLQPTATDVKLAVAMAQFKFNIDHLRAELIAKGINPDSLGKLTTKSPNVFIGVQAGAGLTSGSYNAIIGKDDGFTTKDSVFATYR